MRLLWLADVLRAAGLTVNEVPGWKTRGSDSYGPVYGVTIHETRGSATSTDAGEIRVLLEGSNTANPPIAQLYLSRSGAWWVVASGTCFHNKTGWAGPNEGLGNDSLLGIEAQHAEEENWANKPVQYASYVRGVAALVARGGWPVSRVAGHKEHQPGDKPDPEFNMDRFRSDVAAVLAGEVMLSDVDAKFLIYRLEALAHALDVFEPDARKAPSDLAGKEVPLVKLLKQTAAGVQALGKLELSDEQLQKVADMVAAQLPKPPTAEQIANELAARLAQ